MRSRTAHRRTGPPKSPTTVALGAVLGTAGGPRTVALQIARQLRRVGGELDYLLFTDVPPPDLLPGDDTLLPERVVIPMPFPAYRPVWEHLHVSRMLRRRGAALYHGTKNVLPLGCPCPAVVSIYDLACFTLPETFSAGARLFLQIHTRHAARKAARVLVPSESTRSDLVDRLGIDPARIDVAPLGVSDRFRPVGDEAELDRVRRRYGLPDRIVTYIGTLQPRKQVHTLVEAFGLAKRRFGLPHKLLVAGRRGWLDEGIRRSIEAQRLRDEVILAGQVRDEELPLLYAASELFVSASAYEGFGLTLLEAMASGVPVIGGAAGATPEVVGEAGILVPPGDVEALTEAIGRVTGDEAIREGLREKGIERAGRFTWRAAAEKTVEVYRKVLSTSR